MSGSVLKKKYIGLIGLVLAMLIAYVSYRKWEQEWYRKQIPQEIETAEVILIDSESGLREGCGVAIFKLTPRTQAKLRSEGLAALKEFSPSGRQAWTETPYVETGDGMTLEDSWLGGMSCARMDAALSREIDGALKHPGSFVRKLHEAGVVVIPSSGIVALVYFG